jgi:uncharacterized protein (UPF0147 family)
MENLDLPLLMQAISQRWEIPKDVRVAAVRVLTKLMLDNKSNSRDRNRAIETLLKMEAQNQADEHTAALQSDRNRFLEVAQQLGIDADFRLVGQEPASSSDSRIDGREDFEPDTGPGYRAQADDAEQGG